MDVYRVKMLTVVHSDLDEIHRYISEDKANWRAADNIVDAIMELVCSLEHATVRGNVVAADSNTGLSVRCVTIKNFAVLFEVCASKKQVVVVAVAYARRNIASLLRGRL